MDNREWASLIWIGVACVGCVAARSVRSSLGGVVRAVLDIKILAPIILLAGWAAALTLAGWTIGIWEPSFTFSTVAWFFGSALALLFSVEKVWQSEAFFRTSARRLVGAAAFVAFFMNVFSLHLVTELLLQPVIVLLAITAAVAHRNPAQRATERAADWLLAILGFSLATFTAVQLLKQWEVLDKRVLGLELAVTAWLTLATLPLIAGVATYATYESAFLRIDHALAARRARRRAKIAVAGVLRLHLKDVSAFTFYWAREAGTAETGREARRVVRKFRKSRRADERAKQDAAAKVGRNAGAVGTDSEGRQLDRREFAETLPPPGVS